MTFLGNRRRGQRFPLRMDVTYRVFLQEDGRILSRGRVQTVDMSSTGVLLDTINSCPPGATAELLVKWPSSCEAVLSTLGLHLVGPVVRNDERGTAVRIAHHQFTRVPPDLLSDSLGEVAPGVL